MNFKQTSVRLWSSASKTALRRAGVVFAALLAVIFLSYKGLFSIPLPVYGGEPRQHIGWQRIYKLPGVFEGREHLLAVSADPQTIALILEEQRMTESDTIPNGFWDMPPYYWPRSRQSGTKAYRTVGFSDQLFMLHDPGTNRAYVWFGDF